jgi:superoxide dismutase, Fe-Mn family
VYNHDLYWKTLTDAATSKETLENIPASTLAKFSDFDGMDGFLIEWKKAGLGQFGSGWIWLVEDATSGKYLIEKTGNADSPLIHGKTPLITMDVWEHAYYVDYQNRRADYIDSFIKLIDWSLLN